MVLSKTRRRDGASPGVSPTGWYVAVIIKRFEYYEEDTSDQERTCSVYEHVILIQAKSALEAYDKAIANGVAIEGVECVDLERRKGEFKFVGLNELLPMYDPFEDNAEVLCTDHHDVTVEYAENLCTPKPELGVFRVEED